MKTSRITDTQEIKFLLLKRFLTESTVNEAGTKHKHDRQWSIGSWDIEYEICQRENVGMEESGVRGIRRKLSRGKVQCYLISGSQNMNQ